MIRKAENISKDYLMYCGSDEMVDEKKKRGRGFLDYLSTSVVPIEVTDKLNEEPLQKEPPLEAIEGESKGKQSGASIKRRKFSDLETIYAIDPVVFNAINIITGLATSEGWSVDSKDPKVAEAFKNFLDRINFDEKLAQLAMHLSIYGNAWAELVYGPDKKKVDRMANIAIRDPKSMDFMRPGYKKGKKQTKKGKNRWVWGEPLIDNSGKPVGYVQRTVEDTEVAPDPQKKTMESIHGKKAEDVVRAYFEPHEMAHFFMRKVADSLLGVGLIEPIWKVTIIKLNIEEALGESIYHIGFPTYKAKVGNIDFPPTGEMMATQAKKLANVSNKKDITIPYYVDVAILEAANASDMSKQLDHYINSQIAGLGVARPFALGTGEGANRATLEFLTEIGDRNVRALQRSLKTIVNSKIAMEWYKHYLDVDKLTAEQLENAPTFMFNPLSRRDNKVLLEVIYKGVVSGVIIVDDSLRAFVRSRLGLPLEKVAEQKMSDDDGDDLFEDDEIDRILGDLVDDAE